MTIYIIPSYISNNTKQVIPTQVLEAIKKCDLFFVENIRTARRYISSLQLGIAIEELKFQVLNKKTTYEDCIELIQPAISGKVIGVISESGCPGVADPGARLVHIAHQFKIKVVPLVGLPPYY